MPDDCERHPSLRQPHRDPSGFAMTMMMVQIS
jgi:hypothetical protein